MENFLINLFGQRRKPKYRFTIDRPPINYGRHDVQDNQEYWNTVECVETDTGKLHDGYIIEDDPMIDTIDEFCQEWGIPDDAKILEIGCGGGRMLMLWNFAKERYGRNWLLHGLDHASRAIDVARTRLPSVILWDTEIFAVNQKFDLVFTQTTLQHNSGWKQVKIYPKLHDMIRNNGFLWLINEKTFASEELDGSYIYDYCDDRGSAGTPCWWIYMVSRFGFELLFYKNSSYLFRRC